MSPAAAPALPPFRAIPDLVREHAAARPDQIAVRQGARSLSWREFDAAVDRVAATLQRDGVQPRESIAICGTNSVDYLVLFLGGLRAGAAVAPLPNSALPEQIAGMVKDSGARMFFCDATVPEFETQVPRIFMDEAQALRAWLAPVGSVPQPVAIQSEWPFNII